MLPDISNYKQTKLILADISNYKQTKLKFGRYKQL